MQTTLTKTLTILVAICGLALTTGNALAQTTFSADRDGIEELCYEEEGRFQVSWVYDDKGVQFGPVWTCDAERIKIECRDGACRLFQITQQADIS